jgi:hypothetical protein
MLHQYRKKSATFMITYNDHNLVTMNRQRGVRLHFVHILLCAGLMACNQTGLRHSSEMLPPHAGTSRFIAFSASNPPSDAGPVDAAQTGPCIKDTRSGLIWELKTHQPGLRNQHNTYSWFRRDSGDNGGFAGYKNGGQCTGSRCDTEGYINAINKRRLCSLSHWRLPSREELASLVDYDIHYPGPVLDRTAFHNAVAQFYWSASADANDKDSAWGIGFAFGYDYAYFKSDAARVRLVHDALPAAAPPFSAERFTAQSSASGELMSAKPPTQHCRDTIQATAPESRFIDRSDGTVVDADTGLVWMRCTLGQQWQDRNCKGKANFVSLEAAQRAAAASRYAGYSDWRLPGITELTAIAELRCENPAFNLAVFPATQAVNFWSATPFIDDNHKQWLMQLRYGENFVDLKTTTAQVRLVRTPRLK